MSFTASSCSPEEVSAGSVISLPLGAEYEPPLNNSTGRLEGTLKVGRDLERSPRPRRVRRCFGEAVLMVEKMLQ